VKLPDTSGLTVAYDTEGSGLFADDGARISAVSCAWRDPVTARIVSFSVPFDQGSNPYYLPLGPKQISSSHTRRTAKWDPVHLMAPNRSPRVWDTLHRWLLRQRLVMHHAKHDCLQAAAGLRGREGLHSSFRLSDPARTGFDLMPVVLSDTMLAAGILWPRDPVALKTMAVMHHFGKELGIEEGAEADEQEALGPWKGPKDDPRYDLIPWSVLGPYSRLDAELTLIAYETEQDLLDSTSEVQARLIADDLRLARILYAMERRGTGLDADGMRAEGQKLTAMVADAAKLVPFRGGTGRPTPPAAVKYFFGDPPAGQGVLPFDDKMTRGGLTRGPRPQVDEEVIARLSKMGVPGADEYAAYAELKAANEKWYVPWPAMCGSDGRIRTVHKQGTVISSRLAVERWQAQAMPHDYQVPGGVRPPRYFLVTAPDCEAWEADVSQAEIRIAAAVAREENMIRALRAGADSHDAATKLMFFRTMTLAEARKRDTWEQRRQVSKRCNLGILYGIGARGLSVQIAKFTGIEYPVAQCAEWITDWKRAFPAFSAALYHYANLASEQGYVRLTTGRVRRFSDWEPVHKAFNQRIQGEVAEAAKASMIAFDRDYPGMLLLQIHDSMVAEIPAARVSEVTQAMQDTMVRAFGRMFPQVPFRADVKPFGRLAYKEKA
jgi:DNA polymerase I-like protein with 3'-5' exonuclease and polymerase domains